MVKNVPNGRKERPGAVALFRSILLLFLLLSSSAILYGTTVTTRAVRDLAETALESTALALSTSAESALRSGGSRAEGGGMMQGTFSSAFGSDVVKERVDRHVLGATIGYDWTRSIFSVAGYTVTVLRGDVGSSTSNAGFAGVGYRF